MNVTIKATYDIWNTNTNAPETLLTRSVEMTEERFNQIQNSFGMDYLIKRAVGTSIGGKPNVCSYTKSCTIEIFDSQGNKIEAVMSERAKNTLAKIKATTLDFDED